MSNLCSSVSFILLILSAFMADKAHGGEHKRRKAVDTLRLSKHCSTPMVRLDQYDLVELTSDVRPIHDVEIPANLTCTAHFMTGNSDQGICIENRGLSFDHRAPGLQLKIFTSKFGPDKAFNYFNYKFEKWCTKEPLVSIELTNTRAFNDGDGYYWFTFHLTNESKESIQKHYRMDSFKDCYRKHILKSGEEIKISAQEYPSPSDLPATCQVTVTTNSQEEYEEICLVMDEPRTTKNCLSSLVVSGFNARFWPESETLGCNDTNSRLRDTEMCSGGKTLTLNLTRSSTVDSGLSFTATVRVKRQPYWQVISKENSELRLLDFVKGVTYFVATIDILAGIIAAIVTSMLRRPRSFWKRWAESFQVPEKCENVHYEDSYQAVSSSKVEDIMEVKSY